MKFKLKDYFNFQLLRSSSVIDSSWFFLIFLTLAGLLVNIHLIHVHRSYFSDSGMIYRALIFSGSFIIDGLHGRFADDVFQAPAILYWHLSSAFNVSSFVRILDISYFFGIYSLFLVAIVICLKSERRSLILFPVISGFSLYFIQVANIMNAPSALAFSVLYVCCFLSEFYKTKVGFVLSFILWVLIIFGYQLFFGILLTVMGFQGLKFFKEKKYNWTDSFFFILNILGTMFLIYKIFKSGTPRNQAAETFFGNRPPWFDALGLLFILNLAALYFHQKKSQWGRIIILLLGVFIFYWGAESLYFDTLKARWVYWGAHLRAWSSLAVIVFAAIFMFMNHFDRLPKKISNLSWFLIVLMSLLPMGYNFASNFSWETGLEDFKISLAQVHGCHDLAPYQSQRWKPYGVDCVSVPILSFLVQETTKPKAVLMCIPTGLDDADRPRRTCAETYDIGLFESFRFDQLNPLAEIQKIDFSDLVKPRGR